MSPKKVIPSIKLSRNSITNAGETLRTGKNFFTDGYQQALNVVSERRGLHIYPLNTFQVGLRHTLSAMGLPKGSYFISQRLKRLASIILKLQRFQNMQLAKMQDIGGIRAVLPDIKTVRLLKEKYEANKSQRTYALVRVVDYIDEPKKDGYRGVHMIFSYTNTRVPQASGLQFELQIRTQMQHARATAVETIGTFLGASLKSNQGPVEWLEYFKYVSVGFSYLEGTKIHNDFMDKSPKQISEYINKFNKDFKVIDTINGFALAASVIKKELHKKLIKSKWFLITLHVNGTKNINIQSFSQAQKALALSRYQEKEREALADSNMTVVLVSIDTIKDLQKAYPNYFGDNRLFIEHLKKLEIH